MVYNLLVSPRAQHEVEKAIDSYAPNYSDISNKFIIQLQSAYNTLQTNPFFNIRYKNIRSLKLKKYPYSLYFVVDEVRKTVLILSCFHNKRSPESHPR